MIDLLIDGYPTKIKIDNDVYDINCDYKTGIKIILAMEDKELTQSEKNIILLNLLYKEIPKDYIKALEQGVKFLNCGEASIESNTNGVRVYSFVHDSKYIFSAVNKVLNGKLGRGEFIHWWEFFMAFMDMPEDCQMSRIMSFRLRYANGKLSKEELKLYNKYRYIYEIPEELTESEKYKYDIFMKALNG